MDRVAMDEVMDRVTINCEHVVDWEIRVVGGCVLCVCFGFFLFLICLMCRMRPCLTMSVFDVSVNDESMSGDVCFRLHLDVFRQALLHRHRHSPSSPPPQSASSAANPCLFLIFPPDNQTFPHQMIRRSSSSSALHSPSLLLPFRDDRITPPPSKHFLHLLSHKSLKPHTIHHQPPPRNYSTLSV